MGRLDFAPSSRLYLDASAVIYSVEKIEPYWNLLKPVWQAAFRGEVSFVGSELLLLEVLVKPVQTGDKMLADSFRNLLKAREFALYPITEQILETAVALRVSGLRTPDAIHAATATIAGCDQFITNDSGFRRVSDLPVLLLSNLLPSL